MKFPMMIMGIFFLHGGSRSAQFYYLKLETAVKLYETIYHLITPQICG